MASAPLVPAVSLAIEPRDGLALLESDETASSGRGHQQRAVVFDGIALGAGVYVDAAGRRVRVRADQLPAVAERMRGVFLRDLHREDLAASVGVVAAARVEAEEVRFTGDVRLAPYVDILREFWQAIRFSLGFRYDPAQLRLNVDGTHDLPDDFVVDHVALVPQGQYPNARLVRLLNQARGLTTSLATSRPAEDGGDVLRSKANERSGSSSKEDNRMADDPNTDNDGAASEASRGGAANAASRGASQGTLEHARAERDAAVAAAQRAEAASEASRRELGQAKNRVAADVMKLELAAGKDFDLDQRKQELTRLELAALDALRGELRGAARDATGGAAPTTLPREPAAPPPPKPQPQAALALDLAGLSLNETLRLAFAQGAF
jgi:hypothetical protein